MKIVKFAGRQNANGVPVAIAKGVPGGGYVGIRSYNFNYPNTFHKFGTKEVLEDKEMFIEFKANDLHVFYLNEGEELFAPSTYYPFDLIYYNKEQFSQSQASPINLTGTIQLNQQ